jgi:hypothetical protein
MLGSFKRELTEEVSAVPVTCIIVRDKQASFVLTAQSKL